MKKYITGISLACLALSLIISSCKKHHNDQDPDTITGTWEVATIRNVYVTNNPQTTIDSTIGYAHGHSLVWTFTPTGRYMYVDYRNGAVDTMSKGSYSYDYSRILVTEDGTATPDTIHAAIAANVMTISAYEATASYTMTATIKLNRQ